MLFPQKSIAIIEGGFTLFWPHYNVAHLENVCENALILDAWDCVFLEFGASSIMPSHYYQGAFLETESDCITPLL